MWRFRGRALSELIGTRQRITLTIAYENEAQWRSYIRFLSCVICERVYVTVVPLGSLYRSGISNRGGENLTTELLEVVREKSTQKRNARTRGVTANAAVTGSGYWGFVG